MKLYTIGTRSRDGFTTVNKNFHKFYQNLVKFTSTLI